MSKKNISENPFWDSGIRSYCRYYFSWHLRNLKKKCTSINFWIVLSCDAICILLSYILAYSLRFEAFLLHDRQLFYTGSLIFIFSIKLPIFYLLGLYNGMWRYTSLLDLQNIVKAVFLSSATIVTVMLYINRFQGISRAVFIIDAIICLFLLSSTRISIRFFLHHSRSLQQDRPRRKKRLLMIGAGDAAEKAVREMLDNPILPYEVVGLVDDDSAKIGKRIHGIPVLGTTENLREIADQIRVEELLIAIVSLGTLEMKRIVKLCQKTGLSFKVLPGFGELIQGKISVKGIRDITYTDLLGRAEVKLDQKMIGSYITGQTVLVTGAGGSIGSELCRQIIKFKPQYLVLVEAGEENLYNIQMELYHVFRFHEFVPILCKIQNEELMKLIFAEYRPSVVFHAAAYKHVPLLESNPWEGILNNVLGSKILMSVSLQFRVKQFVLVSTDKAVRPTNVMGATKRLAELLMLSYCRKQINCEKVATTPHGYLLENNAKSNCCQTRIETKFMAVRFGNVLGSSGSVIPLFKRQIEQGGPVTVTDPEVTRYFMSIEEAAQLILQAGAMGEGGEIFLLKMGVPVKIVNLAHDLIKLMGHEPEEEIKITFTGLRPGEKLHEELILEGEGIVLTEHEKIMVLREEGVGSDELENQIIELENEASNYDARGMKEILKKLVPEYLPDMVAKSVIKSY